MAWRICSHLSSISSLAPAPSRRMVSSFVMLTFFERPRAAMSAFSRVSPMSSLMTCKDQVHDLPVKNTKHRHVASMQSLI